MDYCFVHAADLHLDTPFEGVGKVAPNVQEVLQNASLEAFDRLIDLIIEQEARFLILAGDIYDRSQRSVRAQLRFRKGLERLASGRVPVYAVLGNHDPLDGWSAIREWPPNVTFFPSANVQSVKVEGTGSVLATIYGTSYARKDVTENLSLRYQCDPDEGLHIGVLHCNLGGVAEHDAYSPCTEEDLMRAGMNYWALGHIHRQRIWRVGDAWIVYPGNLQGRSLKPSEQGEKGAVVVTVEAGSITEVRSVALDKVRFLPLIIDVSEVEDLAELQEKARFAAESLCRLHTGRHLIVRATLTGRGRLHEDLVGTSTLDGLLAELRSDFESRDPFLFWESLRNDTRAEIDLAAVKGRNDFSSEVIEFANKLLEQRERLIAFLHDQLAFLDKPTLQRWLKELDPIDEDKLVRASRDLALEFLEEGKP